MAYYNNQRNNAYNNRNINYQRNNAYNGYNGYQQQQPTKKSGATYSVIKNGNFKDYPIVNAWRVSRRTGLVKITVAPYKNSAEHKGQNNSFLTMIARIQYENGFEKIVPCLYNLTNKKIVIQSENILITPNGAGVTRSGKRVRGSVVRLNG